MSDFFGYLVHGTEQGRVLAELQRIHQEEPPADEVLGAYLYQEKPLDSMTGVLAHV